MGPHDFSFVLLSHRSRSELNAVWNLFNRGMSRLRRRYQVSGLIPGKKLCCISGGVRDDGWGALYQGSLNIVVGDEGILFADSFWLPRFIVSYWLIPWQAMSVQRLQAEGFEFTVDGIEVSLHGRHVADAIRPHLNTSSVTCDLL